jgi:O-antigen ligase
VPCRASYLLLLSVVLLAPLPFGSVEALWVTAWCVLLAVSVGLFDVRHIPSLELRPLLPFLALGALFLGLAAAQALLPPWPMAWWTGGAPPTGAFPRPSAAAGNVSTPWLSLGPALAGLMSFIASYVVSTDPGRAERLLKAIGLSGAAYAAYGIASLLIDPSSILWAEKKAYVGYLTGTFINRNTAATYFGSCAILWLSLSLSQVQQQLRASRHSSGASWADLRPTRALMGSLSGFLVCLVALFLTASRAGILLSAAILVGVLALFFRRSFPRGARSILAIAGLFMVAALALEFMGGLVALRIASSGLVDEARWLTYTATLAAILDNPWLGTGLGTFTEVFPAYRPAELSTTGRWDHAHSSPLQLALELGIPFFVAAFAVWTHALIRLVRGALSRRRGVKFPVAAAGVLLLGTLHSVVDFSLQIPGYAIVFAAVVGCGLAQAQRSYGSAVHTRPRWGPAAGEPAVSQP